MQKLSETRFRCNEIIARSEYAEDEDIKLYLCVTPCKDLDGIHLLPGFCEYESEHWESYVNGKNSVTTHATVNSQIIISGLASTEPEFKSRDL